MPRTPLIVRYDIALRIAAGDAAAALDICNGLHKWRPEGCGGAAPGSRQTPYRTYPTVPHPGAPYGTLTEAFANWRVATSGSMQQEPGTGDWVLDGSYHCSLDNQAVLLGALAPVLQDTAVTVMAADTGDVVVRWVIASRVFDATST